MSYSFFNSAEPILRRKQPNLDVQDLCGLWQIHWKLGDRTLLSNLYTRIDQVFVLWGWITAIIFGVAQFTQVSWSAQAIAWTMLTLLGTAAMTYLAWYWVKVEGLRWLIYGWAVLMLGGVLLTDYGIFGTCGWILINLCPLWLGLTAAGYLMMGMGMGSRTFVLAALIHGLSIPALSAMPHWPFLFTGGVMSGCLMLLSEVQWDMRSPVTSQVLSAEEQAFNQEQQRLRQLSA
ncbi:MAG: hypothetical protein HC873_00280 [Leptolyngbyaceae cyanobacterium SL_1_1]|nr:hypothetical protein [Leptolyngbyaceae cyanobacterium RM1_1_2]NJO08320.1 hypothetical protein [Leptolyngbyaceae cyanobacterium SL_1_1]